MKKSIVCVLFLGGIAMSYSQEKKELDRKAILDMCGCYEVAFNYAETFAPEADYEKHSNYTAKATELILPIVDEANTIAMQHLLLINDSTVIKHWRQDWLYEHPNLFSYDKDNSWLFKTLPAEVVKGQWTQKVYEVNDSPRYAGTATWVHVDGKRYWENTADAPLSRREYTKRSDYDVMQRGNRHEIMPYGWVHEQDNEKIIRKDGVADVVLVEEKGRNVYTKVADKNCRIAKKWWKNHKAFWAKVREAWEPVYAREGNLTLARRVDGKPIYKHLNALEESNASTAEIAEVLAQFVVDNKESQAAQ